MTSVDGERTLVLDDREVEWHLGDIVIGVRPRAPSFGYSEIKHKLVSDTTGAADHHGFVLSAF